jgi:Sulfotransferase domain
VSEHFLVVGGQRCATTYLHSLLETHPDIAMARPARPEPKVFLSDESLSRGPGWYCETFFGHVTDEHALGEKSTSYLEDPAAAERARAVLGEVKILALLRDPVERAISNWRFSTDNGFEDRSLEDALRANLGGAAEWDPGRSSTSPFAYLERGRYADLLTPWFAAQPGRVHVFFTEELIADSGVLAEVYRALGVDPRFEPAEADQPVNASEEPPTPVPDDLRAALRAYFEPGDQALRELLGREVPWRSTSATGLSHAG